MTDASVSVKDLMLMAYNGGLIGVPDQICLTSEEVQASGL